MNLGVVKSRTHLGYSRVEGISVISYQTISVINRLANLVSSFLDCNQLEMESYGEKKGGGGMERAEREVAETSLGNVMLSYYLVRQISIYFLQDFLLKAVFRQR